MARLNRPNESPPDDFFYVQPETGGRWTGETLKGLVDIVLEHRIYRSLARATFEEVRLDIERQICGAMPPGVCSGEPGEDYRPFEDKARQMTIESIVEFSGAAFRFIQSGGKMVEKSESERRTAICRGCRLNRPSPCIICSPALATIEMMIPSNRIEPGLSACGICGCSLKAKVLLPLATIHSQDADKKYRFPAYCWLNTDGQA